MTVEALQSTTQILLLEERSDEVEIIRHAMDYKGLTVVPGCADIWECLHRRGAYEYAPRPDLILLDLDLSKTENCEVLTQIKRDPGFKRIPVVVLASSESHADVFKAYDLHANAYIGKPADPEELVKVIRATLQFWLSLVRLPRE